jgi:hypothetical protein
MTTTGSGGTVLLVSTDDDGELRSQPCRLRHRLAARLWGPSLDRRLADGRAPDSDPLVATRARDLVAPATRQALGRNWERLLTRARTPGARRPFDVALCRRRISEAAQPAREMIDALTADGPVPAAGVAMASRLLRDGTGPLYNSRCPTDLADALRQVTAHLDPATALDMPSPV